MEADTVTMTKRKPKHIKSNKNRKKLKANPGTAAMKTKKPTMRMMKLFKSRAKAYNSDEDEMEGGLDLNKDNSSDEGPRGLDDSKNYSGSENDEDGEGYGIPHGITKFSDGCRAFRTAFLNIMKKNIAEDPLGPVLSSHKKLVAEKLAEEEAEHKAKGEAKKEKQMFAEKGHVKPAGFLDAKEKRLISVATKGVVKLFNAVNKSQNPQKGLNPSKSKDAKALAKLRKETFLSELKKSTSSTFNSSKISHLKKANDEEPGWAPLRDGYMLTNSSMKDWDKMEVPASNGGLSNMPSDESSSGED